MEIRLLKDNDKIIEGKVIKRGTIFGVTTDLGNQLIKNKEAEEYDRKKSAKKLNVPLKELKDN